MVLNIFHESTRKELVPIHRQTGGQDCGVYAIVISTALAFCHNPAKIKFNQSHQVLGDGSILSISNCLVSTTPCTSYSCTMQCSSQTYCNNYYLKFVCIVFFFTIDYTQQVIYRRIQVPYSLELTPPPPFCRLDLAKSMGGGAYN